ncbi:MAG: sulfite exporter TauE/SafE family protein [Cytophagales bacterium]|nr:sulfite exporter TauE/SafE family protein [Cytophagales bacterium]
MQSTLVATALLMGIAGGPHCVAMCGAACGGMSRGKPSAVMLFHLGRLVGYAVLGFIAASSVQSIGWLSIQTRALRPVWSMLHLAAIALGLVLLLTAKQPAFFDAGAKRLWRRIGASHPLTPLGMGAAWAFMPCGLLYSAVLVAGLSAQAVQGAYVMLAFALGSSLSLLIGPWLWLRLKSNVATGQWGIRLAGLVLAVTSAWGLWMGLMHNAAPWCV